MRKLLYILLAVMLFASCAKPKVDYVFDKLPEQRMIERNAELKNILLSSPGGWKVFMRTSLNGSGYGFYMQFDDKDNVTMLSDWNNTDMVTTQQSTYRIQYISNTTLIFDTYNYIGIMQDPTAANNGGTAREGLQSDVEFEYQRSNGDTVFLKGRKYRNNMYLLKASPTEAAAYKSGGYLTGVNNFNTYFASHSNNYVPLNNGSNTVKVSMFFNGATKTAFFVGQLPDKTVISDTRGFGYSIDGAFFTDAIKISGYKFLGIKQKDANTMVLIDSVGKEYPILQNTAPVVEILNLFGYNKVYNSLYISGQTLPAGVTSDFNSVFTGMVSRFNASGRTISNVYFRLVNSNTAQVALNYASTSPFMADASFTYTLIDNILTLSNYTPNYAAPNWTTRITEIGSFATWFQNGPFKIDWVSSPSGAVLGGLYKVSQPTDFFYGQVTNRTN